MRISDWSSDVCSSDLQQGYCSAGQVTVVALLLFEDEKWIGATENIFDILESHSVSHSQNIVGRLPLRCRLPLDLIAVDIRLHGGGRLRGHLCPNLDWLGFSGGHIGLVFRRGSAASCQGNAAHERSEEHTSELQSLMR